uniref:ATP synthase F0 subunit 8 n=2 Tax=unclassified Phyllothelys TaxID=2628741 RepID=A0A343UMN4_9NEOP|nr:ATP synthase F0 subunit 8 [Phyllothelys sp. 1 JZ-2017]AVE15662.1 ATP synthase F0 subunit 8 [Phyllothelys sp. 2 JZ-2017]
MPQMMPLNWLILFSFFSFIMILFNMINYYHTHNKFYPLPPFKMIIKSTSWKW